VTGPEARPISSLSGEGIVDIDGETFYAIPDVDRLEPFLMSVVGDADHWMFVSSSGGLTAGRRDVSLALFPYETDDRLHRSGGTTGPVTVIRILGDVVAWRPLFARVQRGNRRHLYKSITGNQVVFEEIHPGAGLAFRYRWSLSDRFGFIRTSTIMNLGGEPVTADIVDGIADILPFGLEPSLYGRMSNLSNAYKRSEVIDPETRLAVFSLEARIVDRPEPAEALMATTAWAIGFPDAATTVASDSIAAFESGGSVPPSTIATGRPGAFLLTGTVTLRPGASSSWRIVADVGRTQGDVLGLRRFLGSGADIAGAISASVAEGSAGLTAIVARSDGLQRTGDRVASVHHYANTVYNIMRGGVFMTGYRVRTGDLAAFLVTRNRVVADRHRPWLDSLPASIERDELLAGAVEAADPQLTRLVSEYLPLSFSRRHGDPSRPWNTFSIRVRDEAGDPVIRYEGNWRDIFQNWEALCLSFPQYLPGLVSVFVNASTFDGFNPYRITREGIDWEVPDPDDPWSHIGYWGDHQIVYLSRLLEATRRFLPGELDRMLGEARFAYADVPYDLAGYEEIVRDPKDTIRFDTERAASIALRIEEVGSDGRLLCDREGCVYLVTFLEKLLVPALSKLSNFVPGGGIWMNTQRPEWNDANNALVGHGLSMVTLCHLRRYLRFLASVVTDSGLTGAPISIEVASWLDDVVAVFHNYSSSSGAAMSDTSRMEVVEALGRSFEAYRSGVYGSGFSGFVDVGADTVVELCEEAIRHLDETILLNRRHDGLFHSYNLIRFADDGSSATVERLYEMLEGQVAVLGAGVLTIEERADLLDALHRSAMYRADQRSFMLYPVRALPSFLEKNVMDPADIAGNPLLRALTESGDVSLVAEDPDGQYRFNAGFANQRDLQAALDHLAVDTAWRKLVNEHRGSVLALYEEVFRHHSFTGRSGSMYGYEGIGSIYWHMVAKLLVAVQETVVEAASDRATPQTIANLVEAYERVRGGFGFNKSAAEYGAFPTDPYSHTPAHAGAQQPGMTGQVKEEMLTRPLELGLRVEDGRIVFDPILLRDTELLGAPDSWEYFDVADRWRALELPEGSLAMTLCQVPVLISRTSDEPSVEVEYTDGQRRIFEGLHLDRTASRAVFDRSGEIGCIRARLPR